LRIRLAGDDGFENTLTAGTGDIADDLSHLMLASSSALNALDMVRSRNSCTGAGGRKLGRTRPLASKSAIQVDIALAALKVAYMSRVGQIA
jgi:hypothetical protein